MCDECLEIFYENFHDRENFGNLQFDICATCKDDYLIAPEEFERRAILGQEGSHICDSCITGDGYAELGLSDIGKPYIKSTLCEGCREQIDTCLSQGERHYKNADLCASCEANLNNIDNELIGEWERKNNKINEVKQKTFMSDKTEQTLGAFNDVEEFERLETEYFMLNTFINLDKVNLIYLHIHDPGSYYNEEQQRRLPFLSYNIVEIDKSMNKNRLSNSAPLEVEDISTILLKYGEDHTNKFEYSSLGAFYATNSGFIEWNKYKKHRDRQLLIF